MKSLSRLALAALPAWIVAPGAASANDRTIFSDPARSVSVLYDFTPLGVEFSARLRVGWSFSVSVDGNQDGKWGHGPFSSTPDLTPTPDRRFGQDSRNGVFCSQYVLASLPGDPDQIALSTECNGALSRGSVLMSGFDARMWATITLRIPSDELFGSYPNAHLQICVWDTRQETCEFSPTRPFVLSHPAGSATADATSARRVERIAGRGPGHGAMGGCARPSTL
jgi:hypothetical protein